VKTVNILQAIDDLAAAISPPLSLFEETSLAGLFRNGGACEMDGIE